MKVWIDKDERYPDYSVELSAVPANANTARGVMWVVLNAGQGLKSLRLAERGKQNDLRRQNQGD